MLKYVFINIYEPDIHRNYVFWEDEVPGTQFLSRKGVHKLEELNSVDSSRI